MKRRIFCSVFFTVVLRLQIYESIAAIFWQSASSVFASKLECLAEIVLSNGVSKRLVCVVCPVISQNYQKYEKKSNDIDSF